MINVVLEEPEQSDIKPPRLFALPIGVFRGERPVVGALYDSVKYGDKQWLYVHGVLPWM